MVRIGWGWGFTIPIRSVVGGVVRGTEVAVRGAGVVALSGLFVGETLSKAAIVVVVGCFWTWLFFAVFR